MKNVNQLIIAIMFLLLTPALASSGENKTGVDLPLELANELEEVIGESFNSLIAWNSDTGEKTHFNRSEKDKNGNHLFMNNIRTESIPISDLEAITSYSIVSVTLEDKNYSFCNVIKINGQQKKLICKKTEETRSPSYTEKVKNIPNKLVKELEKLAKKTSKEMGFFIVFGNKNKEVMLLTHHEYELAPAYLLNFISAINSFTVDGYTAYRKNPCCSLDSDNVERCQHICF